LPALFHRKLGRLEFAFGDDLDLVCALLWNQLIPLRDRLRGAFKSRSQTGDTAEVFDDVAELMHPTSVNPLTIYVKLPYSRPSSDVSKLTAMPSKKKRERDPRAITRGIKIREARTERGLSQEAVANALSLKSREAISQWERGDVGEIERVNRLGLCKLLGFEERELLLDPESAPPEFDMPLSSEAKSIAYRWDDLPETLRGWLKQRIAETEKMLRKSPGLAKHVFPEIDDPPPKKKTP